jgi:radical SAM superfamily enzyme YgiQ (UPF0313 family)
MLRVALVYANSDLSETNTSTYALPLGLGSLATYCRQRMEIDLCILDSSFMSHGEQKQQLQTFSPNVVGFNSTIANQENSYTLAKLAKCSGATVIFGGVHSTQLWEPMLRNRDFIDGVVLYDGEIPFFQILQKVQQRKCFGGIPNVAWKRDTIHPPTSVYIPSIEELPHIDYSVFDLNRFFEHTEQRGFGRAMTYYSGKGCIKRGSFPLQSDYSLDEYLALCHAMKTCSFCGRNELGLRQFHEDREARIVHELYAKYNVNGFFNVQDTVPDYQKPLGLDNCWFRVFIGIDMINSVNIQRLKARYGPSLIVQTGIESLHPDIRRNFGKPPLTYDDLFSKIALLEEEGVQLHASFILGGVGETPNTMRDTVHAIRTLASSPCVTWILVSPQLILPGSPDYRRLIRDKKMQTKYASQDLLDIEEISKDFLARFTTVTRESIINEIQQLFHAITRPEVILDVKGVTQKEEKLIK